MTAAFLPTGYRLIFETSIVNFTASPGASKESKDIDCRLGNMRMLLSEPVENLKRVVDTTGTGSLAEQLQRKLTSLKQITANIAMYLDPAWRIQLFQSL